MLPLLLLLLLAKQEIPSKIYKKKKNESAERKLVETRVVINCLPLLLPDDEKFQLNAVNQ